MNSIRIRARKGATVIEVAIVAVIILVFLFILGGSCQGLKAVKGDDVQVEAERQALEHAQKLKYPSPSVTCTKWDTDNDGYVSCTIAYPQGDGAIGSVAVECAAGFNLQGYGNEGCRAPKLKLPAGQQGGL
jgi:hypothetical protein